MISDRGSDMFETARDTIPQGVPEHMIELRPVQTRNSQLMDADFYC